MAWVSPATWVTGAVVSAADLNQELRGQLRYLHGDDGTAQVLSGWEVTGTAAYLRTAGITTTQRDALTGSAGMVVSINGTAFQGRFGVVWKDLPGYDGGGLLTGGTLGDVLYHDGTLFKRLAAGTAGNVLTQGTNTIPAWTPANDILYYNAADVLVIASDVATTSTLTPLGKRKEIRTAQGGLRIKFDLRSQDAASGSAQIYRSGVAIGTLRSTTSTTFVTYSEDIATWGAGTFCQLYVGHITSAYGSEVRNFRIYGTSEAMFKVTMG